MIHEVPMARFAEAAEIANAIAFLASPAAAYITGINVPVDGEGLRVCSLRFRVSSFQFRVSGFGLFLLKSFLLLTVALCTSFP